jgi:anti-sigma factor RsiW
LDDSEFAREWASPKADREVHPHLAHCAACRARYAEFERWVTGLGTELRDEADEAFTGERLALQQAQIARRLETLERPARVIAFPKAARAVINGHSHVRRWVTVAAAASLIAGFSLGQVVPLHRAGEPRRQTPQMTVDTATARAKEITPVSTSQNDDVLLSDAFSRPRVSTLSALDDMTPHVRDLTDRK